MTRYNRAVAGHEQPVVDATRPPSRFAVSTITLTTDFGLSDGYVAAMKGVILGIAPRAAIVDITHRIPPQNVREAAYMLHTVLPYFPPGTVHVAVVDPGVGSTRRALAARVGNGYLVGPDNGVLTYGLSSGASQTAAFVHLDHPGYWHHPVSHTFHGRDIFAPVAAHLATGVPLAALGTPCDDPVRVDIQTPQQGRSGVLRGQIVHVDRFGNLISNIPGHWLAGQLWTVHIAKQQIVGPSRTYAEAAPGQLLALVSSDATLEVAVRDGSAAERLGVAAGQPIEAQPRAG